MRATLFSMLAILTLAVAAGAEVPRDPQAPALVEGHPLTSVVITQCNLILAVYVTTDDGKLHRFDVQDKVPLEALMRLAYSAARSERIEVECHENGVHGFEQHDGVI